MLDIPFYDVLIRLVDAAETVNILLKQFGQNDIYI